MDEITIDDFEKLDIRIGFVTKAEVPEWSHWVMKLTVDFGEEIGERVIFSGIMNSHKPEDVEGKQFPFVVNLKPKKIGPNGDFSNGMLMAADDNETPVLFQLQSKVANGTKVR
ncbi:methionine--tRNA ligase subunit beta [soil metagenome]